MERFWRGLGVALGKYWYLVAVAVLLISGVLVLGVRQLEFATGQDSYLNPESQIALDNVQFQDDFGGETVIILLTASEGSDATIEDLFEGENLATLEQLNEDLADIDEAYAVVTPLTALQFSDNLLSNGVGTNALISAAQRDEDEDGSAARAADISTALARLGSSGDQVIGNPSYNELLLFGNDNYSEDGVAPADDADRAIRLSLAGSFPDQQTAVGGIVLTGNASLDEQTIGTEKVLEVFDASHRACSDLLAD